MDINIGEATVNLLAGAIVVFTENTKYEERASNLERALSLINDEATYTRVAELVNSFGATEEFDFIMNFKNKRGELKGTLEETINNIIK